MLHFKILSVLLVAFVGATTAKKSSEGKVFALSFSQSRSDWDEGDCIIYINAKQDTTANITDIGGATNTHNINANDTLSLYYSYTVRVVEGIESKGILIEAAADVTVMLSNYRNDGNMDAILVPPLHTGTQEYMVISYQSNNDITCVSSATCSFFSVVAYEDDTNVVIQKLHDGVPTDISSFVLNKQDVYTNRTLNTEVLKRSYDFTGYNIIADKQVSVNSGNPCADTNPDEIAGPVWGSIPANQLAGTRYISHTINYRSYSDDTLVRIVALEDDTQVTYGTASSTISYRGEFLEVTLDSRSNEVFLCNKPCKAAQYSTNTDVNSSGGAVFMAVLPDTENYGTNVIFNLPEIPTSTITDYMSIVYLTETPNINALLFDGTALTGWTTVTGEGFSTLEVAVSGAREIAHTLVSPSNIGFAALIHGQGNSAIGYGFIAGYRTGATDPPGNNITRPSPQYRLSMTGNFRSGDGEDFSLSCTDQYSVEMNNEASAMSVYVNDLIGSTLCSSVTTEDIHIVTVSTPFITNGNEGSTELRFVLAPDLNRLTQSQVITCGDEIGIFLVDHDNWKNPIIPQLPECPQVIFNSRMFNDSGKEWVCLNPYEDDTSVILPNPEQHTLKYGLRYTGLFSTVDGSDLTAGCVADLNSEFTAKTFEQIAFVQGLIDAGTICAGTGVITDTATTSLSAQGNQGVSHQNYVLALGDGSMADDVFRCADEMSAYLSPHTEWQTPIIPSVPGCPNVQFDPEVFTEDSQLWICL